MIQKNSEKMWHDFLKLCSEMDAKALNNLFNLFFTYEERETMASRYMIIKALIEGQLTQREMAETYKVSIAQITRGSNALKIIDPKFRKDLESKLKVL